jgi:hypothetical protein
MPSPFKQVFTDLDDLDERLADLEMAMPSPKEIKDLRRAFRRLSAQCEKLENRYVLPPPDPELDGEV